MTYSTIEPQGDIVRPYKIKTLPKDQGLATGVKPVPLSSHPQVDSVVPEQNKTYLPSSGEPSGNSFDFGKTQSNIREMPSFRQLQAWNGEVTSLEDGFVYARIRDTHSSVTEEAEIPKDRIATDDLPFLKVGAPFVWSMGTFGTNGAVVSDIRFHRFAPLTNEELKHIAVSAAEYSFLQENDLQATGQERD